MDPLDELFEQTTAEHAAIAAELAPLEAEAARLWDDVDVATRKWEAARAAVEAKKVATDYRAVCQRLAAIARSRKGKNHSLVAEGL